MDSLKKLVGGFLFLLGLLTSFLSALALFLLTAKFTNNRWFAFAGAIIGLWGGMGLLTAGVKKISANSSARKWAPIGGLGLTFLIIVALLGNLLFAAAPAYLQTETPTSTHYWQLSTGSRLAYTHVAALTARKSTPVIFVHGGPGSPGVPLDTLQHELARVGFDSYFYHQVGAGLSNRLAKASDYTVERHVKDLEAIRTTIGAEQLILVGNSWGGQLIANYMAAHPTHVAKAVVSSPGPIWSPAFTDATRLTTAGRQDTQAAVAAFPRFAFAQFLLQTVGADAARSLLPDGKMDSTFQEFVGKLDMAPGCPGLSKGSEAKPRGMGFWVNAATTRNAAKVPDPRPALKKSTAKTLVMRAQCDYIAWEVTREYRDALPNATLVAVNDAGHTLPTQQPDIYNRTIVGFLLEEPLPLPAYTDAASPWR